MMREDDDRFAQLKARYESELKDLRERLSEREQDLSRQAAEELDLRRRLARLNEQIAQLHDEHRRVQGKLETAQQGLQTAQRRIESFETEHRKQMEETKTSHARVLGERDAQITQLKERIRQLEDLLARSGMPRNGAATAPAR